MTFIYLFSALALLLGIYLAVQHIRKTTKTTKTTNTSDNESSDKLPDVEPVIAPVVEESLYKREERLNSIKNPDIEKPFAKMSVPTPVEAYVIQNANDEPQEVENNDVTVAEVKEIVESLTKAPKQPRQPRTPKPKTEVEAESLSPAVATEAPKKKRRKKRPSKPKTDENTTK